MKNAKTLLAITSSINRSKYLEKRDRKVEATAQKSNRRGIYLGFDATIGMARVRIIETNQTIDAKVITNGGITVGTQVMVRMDGATAIINEMPAR